MSQPAKKFYTPEEYFALEETAEYKSEYFQSEIFARAGGSANHSSIALNVGGALDDALVDQPCRVFNSDIKNTGQEKRLLYLSRCSSCLR